MLFNAQSNYKCKEIKELYRTDIALEMEIVEHILISKKL